jgi:hypothetical protein
MLTTDSESALPFALEPDVRSRQCAATPWRFRLSSMRQRTDQQCLLAHCPRDHRHLSGPAALDQQRFTLTRCNRVCILTLRLAMNRAFDRANSQRSQKNGQAKGLTMKLILLVSAVPSLVLSACISPPKIDFGNIESACAQQCSTNHSNCMSGFKLFPLVAESQCNDAMETCAKTCPPKSSLAISRRNASPVPSSTTEKLKELDGLYKGGLINKADYEAKKQDILRAM